MVYLTYYGRGRAIVSCNRDLEVSECLRCGELKTKKGRLMPLQVAGVLSIFPGMSMSENPAAPIAW